MYLVAFSELKLSCCFWLWLCFLFFCSNGSEGEKRDKDEEKDAKFFESLLNPFETSFDDDEKKKLIDQANMLRACFDARPF